MLSGLGRAAVVVLECTLLAGLSGCGGAERKSPEAPAAEPATPAAEVTSAADEPLPDDVEGTLALLRTSQDELGRLLGGGDAAAGHAAARAQDEKDREHAPEKPTATSTPPDPCAPACRALGSMRRATDHLCGLTAETDARCTDARAKLGDAEARVRASCPACHAP